MSIFAKTLKTLAGVGLGALSAAAFVSLDLQHRLELSEHERARADAAAERARTERDAATRRFIALRGELDDLSASHAEEVISVVLDLERARADQHTLRQDAAQLRSELKASNAALAALGEDYLSLERERGELAQINDDLVERQQSAQRLIHSLLKDTVQKSDLADIIYANLEQELHLEICGQRRRSGGDDCHAEISASLFTYRDDIRRCVMSGQMVPYAERRHQTTPASTSAVLMGAAGQFDEVDLVLCDDKLPEAARPAPNVNVPRTGALTKFDEEG